MLRRTAFAERIASILSSLSLDQGRVFAIRGSWGHGKSSLKNLIIEKLNASESGADWLDFNPWQWPDGEGITRALFKQIADKLGGSYSSGASRRAKKLRQYASILTGAGTSLRKTGADDTSISGWLTNAALVALAAGVGLTIPGTETIATIAVVAGIAAPIIGMIINWLAPDRWSEPLDVVRRDLEDSLKRAPHPLVVFVDDIDRLESDEIRLLIRHVKVNANLPNIVFVLLFQPSIVEKALEPVAGAEGREFLEKIVQANFDLPAVPLNRVHGIFTDQLSKIASEFATSENGFEQVRWGNVLIGCIQPYVRNLRDGRRLLSSIAIHLPLHQGRTAFEVNIIDFFALEALRVFEPDLHADIFREKDLLLQKHRHSGDRQEDANKAKIEAIVHALPEGRRSTARTVLEELFPPIAWVFTNTTYGDDWKAEWINSKRVCTQQFFDRYFELQIPIGSLSESEFVDFMRASADAETLDAIVEDYRDRDLLPALAARMDESVKRLPTENASILLPAMFKIAQSLVGAPAGDPFNASWVSAWRSISWFLDRLPMKDRGRLALDAFKATEALSVAAILISLDISAREEGKQREALFEDRHLDSLKAAWVSQIKKLSRDQQRMLQRDDLASLLFRWSEFSGSPKGPRSWVKLTAKEDVKLAGLIAALMSVGTTHTWGDRVSSRLETFHRDTIEGLFGVDALRKRLGSLRTKGLSDEQLHAIEILKQHLAQWPSEDQSAAE